ncbi:type II secretion system F family protein [Glycomyces luteolus]|uniref:Type II secretion system F family protein n=1 Tax=Glycomyces luteolus TaxID=2670330 RepID=A0A9X3PA56_9ACTN|nr:type II secretion system F family protein [Glycomyces luteolus]MDA1359768.1 type II secretion system F family protein [Glycomyces luteolus]
MNVLIPIVLGGVFGTAVTAGVFVLRPARPAPAATLQTLTGTAPTGRTETADRAGFPSDRVRQDLAAIGQTPAAYQRRLFRIVATAASAPLLLAGLLALSGTGIGLFVPLGLSVFAALIAYQFATAQVRVAATEARDEYRRALAAYLGLAAMRLSAGAGIESALRKAAAAGHGPAFEAIRAALDRAAVLGQTPWDALADLGERIGVAAFEQLGATAGLAGESGARIGKSVADRARALRLARLAELETKANIATERMSLPIVALASSFLLLIGYPSITAVLTGL